MIRITWKPLYFLALATSASAQSMDLEQRPTCSACRIEVQRLTDLDGASFDGPSTNIAKSTRGTIVLVDASDGIVYEYSASGRLVRAIGRKGAGPGEYESVRNLVANQDGSLSILDGVLSRISRYSRDGKFLTSQAVQLPSGADMPAIWLGQNRLVVNGSFRDAAGAGYVLAMFDAAGNRTFIGSDQLVDRRTRWQQRRLLFPTKGGGFILVHPFLFTLEQYDATATKQSTLEFNAPWIRRPLSEEQPSDGVFDKPFTPQIRGVWQDEGGAIWLHVLMASPRWKPGPRAPRRGEPFRKEVYDSATMNRPRVQTRLLVIDPVRRRVTTSLDVDGSIGLPFGGGYLAEEVFDPDGEPKVRLSRTQLLTPRGNKDE